MYFSFIKQILNVILLILQIREKTAARSSPMGRASFSAGTPESSVSEGDGSFHLHGGRKASASARAGGIIKTDFKTKTIHEVINYLIFLCSWK